MSKPYIKLVEGKIVHRKYVGKCAEDTEVKITMTRVNITIGCSTIDVEAAKFIMAKYKQEFESPDLLREVTIQDGKELTSPE